MTNLDSFIDQLAEDGAAPASGGLWRFAGPLLAALAVCSIGVGIALDGAFASVAVDGIGPLLVKWGFSISVLLLSATALWIVGRPGRRSKLSVMAIFVPFVLVGALLVLELSMAQPVFPGDTWRQCLASMLILSPIAFVGAIFGARWLAPTNLRRAGLVAGMFGSAVAMTAYAPFCPERGMAYMAVFYVLPMLSMGALGWLLGPKLLRW